MKAMLIDALHMKAIQKVLEAISPETVGAAASMLSSKKPKAVIRGITDATQYRPKYIPSLALTVKQYIKSISDERKQLAIKSAIINYSFGLLEKGEIFPSKTNIMHFILHLRLCGLISSAEITQILSEKFVQKKYSNILYVWLFCLHAPAISEADPRFCNTYRRFCEDSIRKTFIPEPFKRFFQDLDYYSANNYRELSLMLSDQQPTDTVETAIQRDDVSYLQEYSAKAPGFKFDAPIQPSPFFCSPFIQNSPSLLEYAAFFGSLNCFKLIWLNSPSIIGKSALMLSLNQYAIAGGNVNIIRLITAAGGNFRESLPLAAQFHRHDVLVWIRENEIGKLPEDHPYVSYAINVAASFNNLHALMYFQERSNGIRPFEKAIHAASQNNSLESVKFLLSIQGIDYQTKSDEGMTPLHYAVANGSKDLVKLFLKFDNIDIYAKDDTGDTPMSLAAFNGRSDIQLMLKSAADKTTKTLSTRWTSEQQKLYNNDDN